MKKSDKKTTKPGMTEEELTDKHVQEHPSRTSHALDLIVCCLLCDPHYGFRTVSSFRNTYRGFSFALAIRWILHRAQGLGGDPIALDGFVRGRAGKRKSFRTSRSKQVNSQRAHSAPSNATARENSLP